jgi:C-terminal processing protease CtpA/Prc
MLRPGPWLAAIALGLTGGVTRADVAPLRFDFEQDEVGKAPMHWSLITPGYGAVVTRDESREGRQNVRIRVEGERPKDRVAVLLRSVDARPYRGRTIRMRGSVRTERAGPGDRVQLWLRVDRAGNQMGFFDNMDDRPVRSKAWVESTIVGDVAPDAEGIVFGILLFGDGPAWVDDIRLEVTGAVPPTPKEPARPLAGRGLENLIAFTRLLGHVRHFHPSDAAASADWDAAAVAGVVEVEPAKDPADLARRLEGLFRPVGPTIRVFPTGSTCPIPDELKTSAKAKEVVVWDHFGYGHDSKRPYQIYSSRRRRWKLADGRRPEGAPDPAAVLRADLGGGVSCLVPLALYADDEGTLPHDPKTPATATERTRPAPRGYSGDDRATRLADVALAWNVLQHFYPYFDVVVTDWPMALREALTAAAADPDERAFLATLRRMVAALHDGHGGVHSSRGGDPLGSPPLAWDWIEGRLVVTQVGDGVKDVKPGDIVRTIDGRPAVEALAEVEALISAATPQWRRHIGLQRLARGAVDSPVVVEVEGADRVPRTVRLRRIPTAQVPQEARPPKVHEVRKGIYYVDVGQIDDDDFRRALPDLERAGGIVFDFRGYPGKLNPNTLFSHLTDKPITSPQWHVPMIRRPDHEGMKFQRQFGWMIAAAKPHLGARKAFLTDGRAISYAESCLGIIEHYKLGAIVGGPTAGTNGNVNPFDLPGGYTVVWTGMKVLKHDGSRHHGVGIIPTVPVARTIAGVAAGRDELLEKAIEVVGGRKP